MPRGPHDDEIEELNPDVDHARKRRDEFLRSRFPAGIPSGVEDDEAARPAKPKEELGQTPGGSS